MSEKIIFRKSTKSCCGASTDIIELPVALTKNHLDFFRKAGYNTPDYYSRAGIFHVELQGLTASGTIGGKKLSVRCGGKNSEMTINHFVQLLEKIL